ncbi:hypothetical protein [Pseudorhodobacter ferrugineus]|uniref:hypothetical protein n=1 Tax=Pseudorhodobacter ferrugineus TaxID=77008 RepID=UPI0003B754D2|nr:hypothetical protein [Pseudorhodobacter ferrugineus]
MLFLKSPAARRFTATLAATATALALMTAAAVPARADIRGDDLAKALAAIAAVAIIGSTLNNNKSSRAAEVHQPRYRDVPPRHRRATILPAHCAVEVRGRRHSSVAYPERCLRRAGIDQRLPRQCEIDIHSRGRDRTAYDQNCLLNSGFRTQGRGRH